MEPLGNYFDTWSKRISAEMNGREYPNSVEALCPPYGDRLEYNLGRKYKKLSGIIGVGDNEDSNALAAITVYGDDRVLKNVSASVGKSTSINIDIRNVLRLSISCDPRWIDSKRGVFLRFPSLWEMPIYPCSTLRAGPLAVLGGFV
nr:hypothetical protein GCM10020093_107820 [Planobispora longispora]